jgi:hypothetical protein
MTTPNENGRGESAAHIDILTANPFCAPVNGAGVSLDGEFLGIFDRESSEDLILREKSGIEILRADGWIRFLNACHTYGQTRNLSV